MVKVEAVSGELAIPANALVMLVGASGSGKSWWAAQNFRDTQVVSSDRCRALVADDEADQTVNRQAFAVFYEIVRRRLELGRLAVADSTSLADFARARLKQLAARYNVPLHAVVLCKTEAELLRNNRSRARRVGEDVLLRQARELEMLLETRTLEAEGYYAVHYIARPELARVRLTPPMPALPPA